MWSAVNSRPYRGSSLRRANNEPMASDVVGSSERIKSRVISRRGFICGHRAGGLPVLSGTNYPLLQASIALNGLREDPRAPQPPPGLENLRWTGCQLQDGRCSGSPAGRKVGSTGPASSVCACIEVAHRKLLSTLLRFIGVARVKEN